jgi:hypothetical protein
MPYDPSNHMAIKWNQRPTGFFGWLMATSMAFTQSLSITQRQTFSNTGFDMWSQISLREMKHKLTEVKCHGQVDSQNSSGRKTRLALLLATVFMKILAGHNTAVHFNLLSGHWLPVWWIREWTLVTWAIMLGPNFRAVTDTLPALFLSMCLAGRADRAATSR